METGDARRIAPGGPAGLVLVAAGILAAAGGVVMLTTGTIGVERARRALEGDLRDRIARQLGEYDVPQAMVRAVIEERPAAPADEARLADIQRIRVGQVREQSARIRAVVAESTARNRASALLVAGVCGVVALAAIPAGVGVLRSARRRS